MRGLVREVILKVLGCSFVHKIAIPNRVPESLTSALASHTAMGPGHIFPHNPASKRAEIRMRDLQKMQKAEDTYNTKTKLGTSEFQSKEMKCSQNREHGNSGKEIEFKRGMDNKK